MAHIAICKSKILRRSAEKKLNELISDSDPYNFMRTASFKIMLAESVVTIPFREWRKKLHILDLNTKIPDFLLFYVFDVSQSVYRWELPVLQVLGNDIEGKWGGLMINALGVGILDVQKKSRISSTQSRALIGHRSSEWKVFVSCFEIFYW
ncbi:hypothetical protein PUN28_007057 [Cardiocondyla obscurior]|uniref:Uncharacterized protein n=1 Tax=Cardiocondyla obscurior TaxID=286306 RepID=A0AAW2G3D7_9HYME